jgi:hypothetical protein
MATDAETVGIDARGHRIAALSAPLDFVEGEFHVGDTVDVRRWRGPDQQRFLHRCRAPVPPQGLVAAGVLQVNDDEPVACPVPAP